MATRHRRWPRVLAGVASAIVLLFTAMAGVGAVALRKFDGNITSQAMSEAVGIAASPAADFEPGKPMNILVMGSDNRSALGTGDYGDPTEIEGARSDTAILVHISADRKSALAVSIPRDTVVDVPSCPRFVGGPSAPFRDRFNEAFNTAGPVCTVKTVEQMADITIDHFIIVDFNGFKGVVDALDGVEVCLKQPVDDPLSGLKLPAGTSLVKGEDALAFVRARYTLGDGSDLGRIQRQQAFLASALRKATSLGVLANPLTTYRVLDEVTKSLTTDEDLASINTLKNLALSLSDMKPSDVTFVTLPTFYNDDGATVSPDPALAEPLWRAIREDAPWPPEPTIPQGQTTALTVPPTDISVRVLNGTGKEGAATKAAEQLTKYGYDVVEVGDFDISGVSNSSVSYPPGYAESARTLAYATQSDRVGVDTAADGGSVLTLVVGDDFTKVLPVVTGPAPTPTTTPDPDASANPSPSPSASVLSNSGDTLICS